MVAHTFGYALMGFVAFLALIVAFLLEPAFFIDLLLVLLGILLVVVAAVKLRAGRQVLVISFGVILAFAGIILALVTSSGGGLAL